MSAPIPAAVLKKWRQLAEAATPGPWDARMSRTFKDAGGQLTVTGLAALHLPEDAAFIAAARDAVPALLDEVEKLKCDLGTCEHDAH